MNLCNKITIGQVVFVSNVYLLPPSLVRSLCDLQELYKF